MLQRPVHKKIEKLLPEKRWATGLKFGKTEPLLLALKTPRLGVGAMFKKRIPAFEYGMSAV